MANDAKKISDLTVATTLASTDRVVVLYNATTTANVQTITVSNLFQNMPAVTTTSVAIGTIGTAANSFYANATSVQVGNSSSNTQIQSGSVLTTASLLIGSSFIANTTTILSGSATTGANAFIANSTQISVGNTTVNTFSNSTHFFSGNSTVYSVVNNTVKAIVYSGSGNLVMSATNIIISNTVGAVVTANLTGITLGATANITIAANNGLNLGTGTLPTSANGFAYLPNGLLMNWGIFSANTTTSGNAVFSKTFPTAVLSFTATCVVGAFYAYLTAPATTANAALKSSSTGTGSNVQFIAIGY